MKSDRDDGTDDRSDEEPTAARAEPGTMVCGKPAVFEPCGARTRNGGRCRKAPEAGKRRCKLHGGKTPSGPDSPHFKHGLYSKALPKNLREEYQKLISDPDLLHGRAELAVMQLRLRDMLARLDTGESFTAWRDARERFGQLRAADEAGDEQGKARAFTELSRILADSVDREHTWEEATAFIDQVSRVSERESKRVSREHQTATVEEVRALVASITGAVMLYVTDAAVRLKIAEHINRLQVIEPVGAFTPIGG